MTQELVLEASILTPGCGTCNHTFLGSRDGASPLTLSLAGNTFAAGEVLSVAVYSNQYVAVDQGAAGTSGDQAFKVSGSVALLA